MERMHPRPTEQVFAENRRFRDEHMAVLDEYARSSENENARSEVNSLVQNAMDRERSGRVELDALTHAMSRMNPGRTEMEIGGEESQKIYDELIRGPKPKDNRGDFYTCAYCNKTSAVKLDVCNRCKKVSYCSRECQVAAWPAHKKNECKKAKTEARGLTLTWDQVEAHGGAPARGVLEVRAIMDESMMRQVFQCKDRVGMCRRIAAYTNSRGIPGLRVGATVQWKNPRFHYFMDGSSGARIEEEDLENVTVV
eukprot:jgi/Psemu1/236739/estExt_Genewise1.C_540036